MEPLSTLGGTYYSEEADFMSHLYGNFSIKLPNSEDSSAFWQHHESTLNIDEANEASENTNATFLLEESSYIDGSSSSVLFPTSSEESYFLVPSLSGSQKSISVVPFLSETEHNDNLSPNTMKHSCSLEDVHTSWKRPRFSKSQKVVSRVNIDGVDEMQETNPRPKGVALMLNTNGKKTASSGSAIESQSVYAKKRRERINERLRILQNLVPNGTKVDISTMLEEVEYVKFLQLQIKLLSSDDLWMYAPIAYNAMDLGRDLKLPSPR